MNATTQKASDEKKNATKEKEELKTETETPNPQFSKETVETPKASSGDGSSKREPSNSGKWLSDLDLAHIEMEKTKYIASTNKEIRVAELKAEVTQHTITQNSSMTKWAIACLVIFGIHVIKYMLEHDKNIKEIEYGQKR